MNFFRRLLKHPLLILVVSLHVASVSSLVYAQGPPPVSHIPLPVSAPTLPIAPSIISGKPTHISIPSVGIDLHVLPGEYNKATGEWTLSGYNAHFATMTMPANNYQGNTFIYGHNNKYVFGHLKGIKPGQEIEVTTDNGNKFYYSYVSSETVDPSDVGLFQYKGAPRLTVQTCTGTWYEKRQLFFFKFERVSESTASKQQRDSDKRKEIIAKIGQAVDGQGYQLR